MAGRLSYNVFLTNDVLPDDLIKFDPNFDIHDFLKKKNSFLLNYPITDSGILYPDWLYTECKSVNLNAKHIIVNLQKEHSLITKTSIPSKRVMARALGFGMTDSGDIQRYYGFLNQHIQAIKWIRKEFNKYYRKRGETLKITVDGGLLRLQVLNAMTMMLYRYTPWTGSPGSYYTVKWGVHGVYLFWKLWNQWWKEELKQYNHIGSSVFFS